MLCDVHTTNTLSLPSRLMAAAETKSWKIRLFLYPVGNTAIQSLPWSKLSTAWRCPCFSFRGNLAYSGNFWRAIAMLSWCFKWSMYWSSMLQLLWTCMWLWWLIPEEFKIIRYCFLINHVNDPLVRAIISSSCVVQATCQVLYHQGVPKGWAVYREKIHEFCWAQWYWASATTMPSSVPLWEEKWLSLCIWTSNFSPILSSSPEAWLDLSTALSVLFHQLPWLTSLVIYFCFLGAGQFQSYF